MKLQVLASVMNQKDYSIVDKMNIDSDAIIINQSDVNDYEEIKIKDKYNVQFYSFKERGVGLSRNNALMRADSDIVVFADEDMRFVENYQEVILDNFEKNPKADMIIFNVPSLNKERPTAEVKKNERIHIFNGLRYGAVNFAVRLNFVRKNNIFFSLLFGGGAKYSAGEDSLFIHDVLKNNGHVLASKDVIGYVEQKGSTWFKGFDDNYFSHKGVFYYCMSKKFWLFWCLQFLIRHPRSFKNIGFFRAINSMIKGAKEIKNEK